MSDWAAKRFWTKTEAVTVADGHSVELDGRSVRTPAKTPLVVPTPHMAQAIAAEWDAQDGAIDPLSMPVTRSANAALDKVGPQRADVVSMIAEYGNSDMLCYRADHPEGLVDRQAQEWDPFLAWSRDTLGAELNTTRGIIHVSQPQDSLDIFKAELMALTDFELAAVHDLVMLSGSLVLGFSVAKKHATAAQVWPVTRLDEVWQQEQWGVDEDAESLAATKEAAFVHAERFLTLARAV